MFYCTTLVLKIKVCSTYLMLSYLLGFTMRQLHFSKNFLNNSTQFPSVFITSSAGK